MIFSVIAVQHSLHRTATCGVYKASRFGADSMATGAAEVDMSAREKTTIGGWHARLRTLAQQTPVAARIGVAHGARVADPMRHAWRDHLAGLAAARG